MSLLSTVRPGWFGGMQRTDFVLTGGKCGFVFAGLCALAVIVLFVEVPEMKVSFFLLPAPGSVQNADPHGCSEPNLSRTR